MKNNSTIILSNADFSTNAAGFADTQAQAFSISPNAAGVVTFSLSLSSSTDVDWYKWTNNTGRDKFVSTVLTPINGGTSNYILDHEIVYANGLKTGLFSPAEGNLGIHCIVKVSSPYGYLGMLRFRDY